MEELPQKEKKRGRPTGVGNKAERYVLKRLTKDEAGHSTIQEIGRFSSLKDLADSLQMSSVKVSKIMRSKYKNSYKDIMITKV